MIVLSEADDSEPDSKHRNAKRKRRNKKKCHKCQKLSRDFIPQTLGELCYKKPASQIAKRIFNVENFPNSKLKRNKATSIRNKNILMDGKSGQQRAKSKLTNSKQRTKAISTKTEYIPVTSTQQGASSPSYTSQFNPYDEFIEHYKKTVNVNVRVENPVDSIPSNNPPSHPENVTVHVENLESNTNVDRLTLAGDWFSTAMDYIPLNSSPSDNQSENNMNIKERGCFQGRYFEDPNIVTKKNKSSILERDSLDNRKCYLCGDSGHFNRDCPEGGNNRGRDSEDIMCYRCNALGHIARNCNRAPKCYNCNTVGHIACGCKMNTSFRRGRDSCSRCNRKRYSCSDSSHFNCNCPEGSSNLSSRGGEGNSKDTVCFICKGKGHIARNCSWFDICYKCGLVGHIARDCGMANMIPPSYHATSGVYF